MKSHWLGLAWMLALLCAFGAAVHAEQALPSAPLPLLDGGSLNIQDLRGQVVVIRFLASW